MAKKLTPSKAKEILHDKSVHGYPLTDKQRRFFGAVAGGAPINAQDGKNLLNKQETTNVWQPRKDSGSDTLGYSLRQTITPYTSNRDIRRFTQTPTGPEDVNFLYNYGHALGKIPSFPTQVPFEGDKHWNIDRFIIDPQFGQDYTSNFNRNLSKEQNRANVLADMYKYYMLQDPEHKRRDFRKAKRFVRKEIDPKISGDYYNFVLSKKAVPSFNVSGIENFANQNPLISVQDYSDVWSAKGSPITLNNPNYNPNEWTEERLKGISMDYLKNYKQMSNKDANALWDKWIKERDEDLSIKEKIKQRFKEEGQQYKTGGWLDSYKEGGVESRMGGLTDIPFNYNSAWGGQFAEGGELMQNQEALQKYVSGKYGAFAQFKVGGSIPKAQNSRIVPYGRPTASDSSMLYNRALAIQNYYDSRGYTKNPGVRSVKEAESINDREDIKIKNIQKDNTLSARDKKDQIAYIKERKSKTLKQAQDYEKNVKARKFPDYLEKLKKLRGVASPSNYKLNEQIYTTDPTYANYPYRKLTPNEKYYTPINKYQFGQREQSYGFLDYDSPMPIYDTRIVPQGYVAYRNYTNIDRAPAPGKYDDQVELYTYDPLAVKPYAMRTAEEKVEWERLYGKNKNNKLTDVPIQPIVTQQTTPSVNQPAPKTNETTPYSITWADPNENPNNLTQKTKYFKNKEEWEAAVKASGASNITQQGNSGSALLGVRSETPNFNVGGSLPGSTGFTYARTGSIPSNGKYAKKTLASAQNGMTFYQHGLDWKPRTISRDGSIVPKAQTGKIPKLKKDEVYVMGEGVVNINSDKYKQLYEKGIGRLVKFDESTNSWVRAKEGDPNSMFVSSSAMLPPVDIIQKRNYRRWPIYKYDQNGEIMRDSEGNPIHEVEMEEAAGKANYAKLDAWKKEMNRNLTEDELKYFRSSGIVPLTTSELSKFNDNWTGATVGPAGPEPGFFGKGWDFIKHPFTAAKYKIQHPMSDVPWGHLSNLSESGQGTPLDYAIPGAAAVLTGGALASPAVGTALTTPIITAGAEYGTGALTAGNILAGVSAYQGAKNVPNVVNQWQNVKSWKDVPGATANTLMTAIDMAPMAGAVIKGVPSVVNDVSQIANASASSTVKPLINTLNETSLPNTLNAIQASHMSDFNKYLSKNNLLSRQIFGDEALQSFKKFGPTVTPEISQSEQLVNFALSGQSSAKAAGTGEVFNTVTAMVPDEFGSLTKRFAYPYFSNKSLWYGNPKTLKNLTTELGNESVVVADPKNFLEGTFRPAGESTIMTGEPSQKLIEQFAGKRRAMLPYEGTEDPSKFKVFNRDWNAGYVPENWNPWGNTSIEMPRSSSLSSYSNPEAIVTSNPGMTMEEAAEMINKFKQERLAAWNTEEGKRRIEQELANNPMTGGLTYPHYVSKLEELQNTNALTINTLDKLKNSKKQLESLTKMHDAGLISQDEFVHRNNQLVDEISKNATTAASLRSRIPYANATLTSKTGTYPSSDVFSTELGTSFTSADAPYIVRHELGHLGQMGGFHIDPATMKVVRTTGNPSHLDLKLKDLELLDEEQKFVPTGSISIPLGEGHNAYDIFGGENNYFNKAKEYFSTGSSGLEKVPFAEEVRADLLEKGVINNIYDPITDDMLIQHFNEYKNVPHGFKYPLRLYDIMKPTKKNFSLLNDVMNNMKMAVPAVGAGALGAGAMSGGEEQPAQQKKGGVVKDNNGYWNRKNWGKAVEIQGNKMATHGYGDLPLYVVPDVGQPRLVEANTGIHEFPGATKFTEYPIMKNGGGLPKAQFGYDRPSRTDSLNLLNNSIAVNNYYNRTGTTTNVETGLKNNAFNELKRAVETFKKTVPIYPVKSPSVSSRYEEASGNLPMSEYHKPVDKNKFYQREIAHGILDTRAPMQLFDRRITPTLHTHLINENISDPMSGDFVDMYGYDPLAITPWDQLKPEQQKQRLKIYGTVGTPYEKREEPGLSRGRDIQFQTFKHDTLKPNLNLRDTQLKPSLNIPPVQQGNYMVGYIDESGQGVDRGFVNPEQRDAFVEELRNRNLSSVAPYRGAITQYQRLPQTKKVNQKSTGGWLDGYK